MCEILGIFSNLPVIIHIFNTSLTLHFWNEKYISHAEDKGNRLLQIVEDLLGFA